MKTITYLEPTRTYLEPQPRRGLINGVNFAIVITILNVIFSIYNFYDTDDKYHECYSMLSQVSNFYEENMTTGE